ncbi:MAG: DMT family transporter [Oscillospiraceae bacterium]|nr:DMT family transporter [Oscillospiraceae bacterium]MBQ7129516.1 DMT family transporter [Oscillospiraceae bacterium]
MQSTKLQNRGSLILSMCIFGTIGILRRYIPLSSSLVALVRGIIGSVFLILVLLLSRKKPDLGAIRKNWILLALSGAAIGFNWILLFEAYNYTSVATATLCYYLAPILVILASPVVLGETMTAKKLMCTMTALAGMVLVSGVLDADFSGMAELKGILFGIGAAVLYASVILMNKKMTPVPAYDKTILQLSMAAVALLPYVLLTEDWAAVSVTPLAVMLLCVAGIVHTGIAYWLYFGSMGSLPSHTVALLSYIDPILAIVLSMVLLKEPMSLPAGIGAVMVLGAAYISEKQE